MNHRNCMVGAYYFPNFHLEPHNEAVHGPGWTEWELIRRAKPRFPGHRQPRTPLWGYQDESDPEVMREKIDAAADHGLDFWFFDYYHYQGTPFLNGALDRGFLKAPNRNRLKFALMWANHDWYSLGEWDPREKTLPPCEFSGFTTEEQFEAICDDVIERYFLQPNYWTIDGCPVFSIYESATFMSAFASSEALQKALARFRNKVRKAGFRDLHLNLIYWGIPNLPGGRTPHDWNEVIEVMQANSLTSYTWVHHGMAPGFPCASYADTRERYFSQWRTFRHTLPVPYFPNVTIGWDNTPRCKPGIPWDQPLPHTVTPILAGNTPEEFQHSLEMIREELDTHSQLPAVVTINAWNEWPESSCLEPDTVCRYGYLDALQKVFPPHKC